MEGDYDSPGQSKFPISTYRCSRRRVWISPLGAASIRVIDKIQKRKRKFDEIENVFKDYGILEDDECIQVIMEEVSFTDSMKDLLEYMQQESNQERDAASTVGQGWVSCWRHLLLQFFFHHDRMPISVIS